MSRLDKEFTATLQRSRAQGAETFVVLPDCHVHRHRGWMKIVGTVDGHTLRRRLACLVVYPLATVGTPAVWTLTARDRHQWATVTSAGGALPWKGPKAGAVQQHQRERLYVGGALRRASRAVNRRPGRACFLRSPEPKHLGHVLSWPSGIG